GRETGCEERRSQLGAGVGGGKEGSASGAATGGGGAGGTTATGPILAAGTAAVVGGAVSMALGEYVSVSSQSDSEKAKISAAKQELEQDPRSAHAELAAHWRDQGLAPETAEQVATELQRHDALG
ncbi:VIT family protein, partial [Bacilli bacterium]